MEKIRPLDVFEFLRWYWADASGCLTRNIPTATGGALLSGLSERLLKTAGLHGPQGIHMHNGILSVLMKDYKEIVLRATISLKQNLVRNQLRGPPTSEPTFQ